MHGHLSCIVLRMWRLTQVRVRRPNDYNPAAASSLGPSLPSQNLNLAAIGLGTVRLPLTVMWGIYCVDTGGSCNALKARLAPSCKSHVLTCAPEVNQLDMCVCLHSSVALQPPGTHLHSG